MHNAIIIEDAAKTLGADYKGIQTGNFGAYNAISFNGNKIITGSLGEMFLTNSRDAYEKVKNGLHSPEKMHHGISMSNLIAGVVQGCCKICSVMEREGLPKISEKTSSKDCSYRLIYKMLTRRQGWHVHIRKEMLDNEGNIRKGSKVIKKGEIYERNLFLSRTHALKQRKSKPTTKSVPCGI